MDAISYSYADKQAKRITKFNANPDSNSGIVTVPKVIEAGESVTVPAGRVAVLPNVRIDGEIVVEGDGEIFIPAGAGFGDLDQRIDTKLDKDFSSFPDKPTPVDTDNFVLQETSGLFKKLSFANLMNWVKSFSLGWGQTWKDVTSSRSNGVTYTNNTGKPIQISIVVPTQTTADLFTLSVNGTTISSIRGANAANVGYAQINATIPESNTYILTKAGTTTIISWAELR